MPIQIKELISSDSLSQAIDKLNFNFDQLILSGGGPPGPIGVAGPVGPNGAPGVRGSQWTTSPAGGTNGAGITTAVVNDKILDSAGAVWQYNGTVWIDSTVNLKGEKGDAGSAGTSPEIKRYKGIDSGGKWLVKSPIDSGATNVTATPDFFGYYDNDSQSGINVHVFGHLEDLMTAANAPSAAAQPTAIIMQSNTSSGLFIGPGSTATSGGVGSGAINLNDYSNIYKGIGGLIIDAARDNNVGGTKGNLDLNAKGIEGKVTINSVLQDAKIFVGSNTSSEYGDILLQVSNTDAKIKLQAEDSILNITEDKITFNSDFGGTTKDRLRIASNGFMRLSGNLKVNNDTNLAMHWSYALKVFNTGGDSVGDHFGLQLGSGIATNLVWGTPTGSTLGGWVNEEIGGGYRIDLKRPGFNATTGLPNTNESEIKLTVAGDSRNEGNTPTPANTGVIMLYPVKIQTYDGKIKLQDDSNISEGVTIGKHNMPDWFLTNATAASGSQPYKTLLVGSNSNIRPRVVVGYNGNDYTAIQHVQEDSTNQATAMIYGSYDGTIPTTINNFTWGKVSGTSGQVVYNFGSGILTSRNKLTTDKLNVAGGIKLTANSMGFPDNAAGATAYGYSNIGRYWNDMMFANANAPATSTSPATPAGRSTIYFGAITEDPIADLRLGNTPTSVLSGVQAYSSVNIRSDAAVTDGNGLTLWDKVVLPTNQIIKIYTKHNLSRQTDYAYNYHIGARGYMWANDTATVANKIPVHIRLTASTGGDVYLDALDDGAIRILAKDSVFIDAGDNVDIEATDDVKIKSTSDDITLTADDGNIELISTNNSGLGGNQILLKGYNSSNDYGYLLMSGSIDSNSGYGFATKKGMSIIKAHNKADGSSNYDDSVLGIGAGWDDDYPFLFLHRGFAGLGKGVKPRDAYGTGATGLNGMIAGKTRLLVIGQGDNENPAKLQTTNGSGILVANNGTTRITGGAQIVDGHDMKSYDFKIPGGSYGASSARWRFASNVGVDVSISSGPFDRTKWTELAKAVHFDPENTSSGYQRRTGFADATLNNVYNAPANFDRFLQFSRTSERFGADNHTTVPFDGKWQMAICFVREIKSPYEWRRVATAYGSQGMLTSFIPAGCYWALGVFSWTLGGKDVVGDVTIFKMGSDRSEDPVH